jgi:hypothetical protein
VAAVCCVRSEQQGQKAEQAVQTPIEARRFLVRLTKQRAAMARHGREHGLRGDHSRALTRAVHRGDGPG